MNTSKIIKGVVGGGRYTVTAPITQGDYGYIFQPVIADLPTTYRLDFSNDEYQGTAYPVYCGADGGEVPKKLIDTGKDIFVWLFYLGDGYGKSTHKWKIPNKLKPKNEEEQPEPSQQSSIDQLITRSNEAVESAEQSALEADQSAQSAKDDADRAEQARYTSEGFAQSAEDSAENARLNASQASASATASAQSAQSASQSAQDAQDTLEEFTTPTASAITLPEGSNATASYTDGHFTFGIPTGATGAKGDKGDKGDTGIGEKGDKGDKGDTGERGPQGEQGVQGIQGPKGDKGDTGSQGPKWDKGDTGAQGIQGPKGDKVDTGEQGIQGPKGDTGATGPQGEQGIQGAKGDTGDDGISPTVSITPITGGHRITITDKDGEHSADVMDGTGNVDDVQINGGSIVVDGVANVPIANAYNKYGLVKVSNYGGVSISADGEISTYRANLPEVKSGTAQTRSLTPHLQHASTFYGLAKAAGDTTQSASSNAVGNYTEDAKVAIQKMLGINQQGELIANITTEEDVAELVINTDSNGLPFELKKMIAIFEAGAPTTGTRDAFYIQATFTNRQNNTFSASCPSLTYPTATVGMIARLTIDVFDGMPLIPTAVVATGDGNTQNVISMVKSYVAKNIKAIRIYQSGATKSLIPAGSNIKVYGIRA